MRMAMSVATLGLLAGLGGWAPPAHADYRVTCASDNNQYTRCRLDEPGFVTLRRQLSKTPCAQGRSWDWDRREVWVDDGCRAEFEVSTSSHGKGHSDGDAAKVAAGVIVGAAILGALAHNKDHRDDDKYRDDNYHGGRHTSYVPGWMVGTFRGYNPMYGADVEMTIADDGRVTAFADPKCARSARLRAAPTPGTSSSGVAPTAFALLARCVPMANRCASSRRRWMK